MSAGDSDEPDCIMYAGYEVYLARCCKLGLEPLTEHVLLELVQGEIAKAWELIESHIVGDCGSASESYQSKELTSAIYLVREKLGIPD